MRILQKPPEFGSLLRHIADVTTLEKIATLSKTERTAKSYLHWDKLRRLKPPEGLTKEAWWLALKLARGGISSPVPLNDKSGQPFQFCVPDLVQEGLHRLDVSAGALVGTSVSEPIINPQTKDRYLIRSLMEEAITSSQLEGAVTTREVAKELILTQRAPRDTSERMILNNFNTMQRITELKKEPLSPEMVFEIHRCVTEQTLDDESAAGRFRRSDEKRVVGDDYGEVYHDPPAAEELSARLAAMCDFANSNVPFVHPAVRAIILHFWLAYDHPFVDGNGRTARALFYWAMLHHGYWLFEFISISQILRKAPIKYGRSFLYTETDANDLTYFIVAQMRVISQAIEALHKYIDQKNLEIQELESHLGTLSLFNYRQAAIIRHALKHPFQIYTIASHQKSNGIAYQTARTDLLTLKNRGILNQKMRGKEMVFTVPKDLVERLRSPTSISL